MPRIVFQRNFALNFGEIDYYGTEFATRIRSVESGAGFSESKKFTAMKLDSDKLIDQKPRQVNSRTFLSI